MKISRLITALILYGVSMPLHAQVLSSPGGTVSDNGTVDEVLVNGQLKASNSSGRSLVIERDDDDPFMTFHDPGDYWYSMGIDRSNSGVFILNNGGVLGTYPHFVMNNAGYVGLGVFSPVNELDVNGRGRFRRQGSATSGLIIGGDALSLQGWGANNPYIEWINSGGVRQGYFGWNTNRLSLVLENQHNFTIENGSVGIGTDQPATRLDVNGDFQIYPSSNAGTSGALKLRFIPGNSSSVIEGNSDLVWADHDVIINGANSTSGNTNQLVVHRTGNVGIGTSTPSVKLEVKGNVNVGTEEGLDTGYGSQLQLLGAALNGDRLWLSRYNNGSNQTELRVNIGDDYGQAEDMFVVGTHYWNGGAWHPHLAVQASGNVGIGTTNTHGFRLAVAGKAIAEELVVQLEQNWPDFVFDQRYKLPSLSELEQFILLNKHLPDVPTAEQVQTDGVSLGQMNAILLQKIEELTLHLIQQDKINTEQAKRIDYLEAQRAKAGNKKRRR